jgi:hypothetical protein
MWHNSGRTLREIKGAIFVLPISALFGLLLMCTGDGDKCMGSACNFVTPNILRPFHHLVYPTVSALLLQEWEPWTYLDSFYFCFISVFTIGTASGHSDSLQCAGFGDFIPARTEFYPLTIVFILLGLIITTMCVDLVAVQSVNKIHYFGRAMGDARCVRL